MLTILSFPAAALLALAVGQARPALAGWAATLAAVWMVGALGASWALDPLSLDMPWFASLGSRFALELDALGAPLAVYTAGLAVPVLAYGAAYMPAHLHEKGRPPRDGVAFFAMMLVFMLAMVLLMLAQDLLLIFLALELTALMSFLLIRFDEDEESLAAARTALTVTAGTSLLFLLGLLMIAQRTGTTSLAALRQPGAAEAIPDIALVCMVAGVLAKSAQMPLHFWLPRAMTAPTPVSAYLHSAAMVSAGLFVLLRIRFLLEGTSWLLDGMLWLGFASLTLAGLFALGSDRFKRVLAYSTIAQYGYGLVMLAAGGRHGLLGASFFIMAHGLAKCALFMTAGAVTQATGEERISNSGGLGRSMPLLALASLVAVLGVAGLPLTIGFFKDELLLKTMLDRGPVATGLATAAIAMTLAYLGRLWLGIFAGRSRPGTQPPTAPRIGLVLPVVGLSAAVALFGIWSAPLEQAFRAAATVVAGEPVEAHIAYPDTLSLELKLSLAAWAAGLALAIGGLRFGPILGRAAAAAGRAGPGAAADLLAEAGRRLSHLLHELEVRDARNRLSVTLAAAAVFVLMGIFADRDWPRTGALRFDDIPVAATLLVAALAAPIATAATSHTAFVMLMSFVGMSLALVFALAHAPDVALLLVVVQTMLTLLFIAVLSRMPHDVLMAARRKRGARRSVVVGVAAGIVATVAAWLALSVIPTDPPTAEFVRLAETAHGKDVVTVILADFRGLGTAGEMTVLVVAIIGATAIWAGRRA